MGSKRSKNSSRGSKQSDVAKVDRISNLPDSLLLVILSLLPFQLAVRTSVLSKRWRPLCMSLSNLCFDDNQYGKKSGAHFVNSFDRFLMLRPLDLKIEQFNLTCVRDNDYVDEWICKALEHQVKDLSLDFSFKGVLYDLHPDIYSYGKLEVLRLKWGILVDVPDDFSFSRLKVLEFWHVTFSDYESVEDILLNCPVLEDLLIKKCKWPRGSSLTVCGSVLKNLTLKCNEHVNRKDELEIVINTPALETLRIGDTTWADIYIEGTLLSLRTAYISVQFDDESVFELLENIYNVKFLTLTDKTLGALDGVSDYDLPTYHNLIQLELRVHNWSCWNLLPDILASSPNLQNLLLPNGVDLIHTCQRYYYGLWGMPKLVPECVSSKLKTIVIGVFHGTDDELKLVEYLLLYGRALRKISIDCSCCSTEWQKLRIRKKLMKFDKGSRTCKIDLIIN